MNDQMPTSVAVLGTLTEFHKEPIPYDLAALVKLVQAIHPDLLCLDMTLAQWQSQAFAGLPAEYVEALLPLAAQTDIVVAPIGGDQPMPRIEAGGWRGALIRRLRAWLAWLERTAPSPAAINEGWRHELGNALYGLARRLAGRHVEHAYHERTARLTDAVVRVAGDNPGSRILVVTNIQYCHHIRPGLGQHPNLTVTTYAEL